MGYIIPALSHLRISSLTESHYYWEEPELFILVSDQIFRRCIPEEEQLEILKACHSSSYGGHYSSKITTSKVLQSGFY